MDKTAAEYSVMLDEVEKTLDKEEGELTSLQEEYLTYGRDITILQLKRKDKEIPITQKKFCIRVLGRKYTSLKRKFYQAKNSGL